MVKEMVSGRVEPSVKVSIKILAETEGVTVGALLEMALNLYIPAGESAREWQVKKLSKQLCRLEAEKVLEHSRIDERFDQDIERIRGHLLMIKGLDKNREQKIIELIPRYIDSHDLGHRRSDPHKIIKRRAVETPTEQVPWFTPFGISITWGSFLHHIENYLEDLRCGQ